VNPVPPSAIRDVHGKFDGNVNVSPEPSDVKKHNSNRPATLLPSGSLTVTLVWFVVLLPPFSAITVGNDIINVSLQLLYFVSVRFFYIAYDAR
jgi:hypothetical protein